MNVTQVIKHLDAICPKQINEYENYFNSITPETPEDIFRRCLFSYASVHTSWKSNCNLYLKLKDLDWLDDPDKLLNKIIDSKAGLHNIRSKNIMYFSRQFWDDVTIVDKKPSENWFQYRDRIMDISPGLGKAKSAFLIELLHFQRTGIACFDTHMLQLYGLTTKQIKNNQYSTQMFDRFERHWTEECYSRNIAPVTARWLMWDKKQKKKDSRYWSYVLEA